MEFEFIEKELEEEKVKVQQPPVETQQVESQPSDFSIPTEEPVQKPRSKAREMANLVSGRVTGSEPQVTSSNVPTEESPVSEVEDEKFDFNEVGGDWIGELIDWLDTKRLFDSYRHGSYRQKSYRIVRSIN